MPTKKGVSKKPQTNKKEQPHIWKTRAKIVGKYFLIPVFIYTVIFFILSPQYLTKFSSFFYNDGGDGFQNVWNIWWVNRALTETGQNPWFTNMLHWPTGVSLLPQTMNIFNAFLTIPFIHLFDFSLIQAYNFAFMFSFIMGGVTMFWLILKWYKVYWVAIVAGIMFTFSNYHFAHGLGHLQLIALEWIPLFILAFWNMVEKMRYRDAAFAAGALLLVALCDYYYLIYCVIVGVMWLGYQLWKKEFKINKHNVKVLLLFGGLCLISFGPLVIGLSLLNIRDPLQGTHDPLMFNLDIFTPFVPGGSWYWHRFTDFYTSRLPYHAETSVFFGFTVLILLAVQLYWLIRRKKVGQPKWLNFWWFVLLFFGVMSLGPHLSVFGHKLVAIPLPYLVAEKLLPTLKISGMPVRWILMSQVAAIIIASFVMTKIDLKQRWGKIIVVLGAVLLLIELYPRPLPLTSPNYLPYVDFLKTQPAGAVIDNAPVSGTDQLYYQTIYERPAAFGYTTRVPRSVDQSDFHIFAALEQGRYDMLCRDYKIRYVITRVNYPMEFPVIYRSNLPDNIHIYDVKNSYNC